MKRTEYCSNHSAVFPIDFSYTIYEAHRDIRNDFRLRTMRYATPLRAREEIISEGIFVIHSGLIRDGNVEMEMRALISLMVGEYVGRLTLRCIEIISHFIRSCCSQLIPENSPLFRYWFPIRNPASRPHFQRFPPPSHNRISALAIFRTFLSFFLRSIVEYSRWGSKPAGEGGC